MFKKQRHVNTDSDSELLLNLFAESLTKHQAESESRTEAIFATCKEVMNQCKGGYATVYYVNGVGLVAFRDPHGIRPLVFGCRSNDPEDAHKTWTTDMMENAEKKLDYCISSESVASDTLGFQLVR
jgi:amidophosphoribosyltransferase